MDSRQLENRPVAERFLRDKISTLRIALRERVIEMHAYEQAAIARERELLLLREENVRLQRLVQSALRSTLERQLGRHIK